MTGLLEGLKSILIEALIPEGTFKDLDVSALRWAARLDQDVLGAMLLRSGHERPASELSSVISSSRLLKY